MPSNLEKKKEKKPRKSHLSKNRKKIKQTQQSDKSQENFRNKSGGGLLDNIKAEEIETTKIKEPLPFPCSIL